jgi:alpha-glucosidase
MSALARGGEAQESRAVVTSPGGRNRAEFFLTPSGGGSRPRFRVSFDGRPVVLPSPLGVDLADGPGLGDDTVIESSRTRTIDETYAQFPGKRSRVVDRCSEAVVSLRERAAPGRRWQVLLRAFDDGIAFRYRFPARAGWPRLEIAAGLQPDTAPADAPCGERIFHLTDPDGHELSFARPLTGAVASDAAGGR